MLGYTGATFMALGTMFGALNCRYSAVASRQVGIATLRAIGFGSVPVVVSVMLKALVLALLTYEIWLIGVFRCLFALAG